MRKWLYKLRTVNNLTQMEVAKKLRLSIQQYNYIELGTRQVDMNLSTITGLSKIFEIPIDDIIKKEKLWLRQRKKEKKGE